MSNEEFNLVSPNEDETSAIASPAEETTLDNERDETTVASAAPAHKNRAASPATKPRPASRYQNEVTLRGEIVKLIASKNVTVVTVCTRTTITVHNYPTVVFFGENGAKAAQFKEKQRVLIKATIQSYDETKLRKGQSPVLIVGLSIVSEADVPDEERDATDDIDLKPIEAVCNNDENRIEIRGQILALECDKNNEVIMTVKMVTGGRWSIVKFPYSARNSNYFLRQVYVKQFIRALGTVQTSNIPVEPEETTQAKAAEIEKSNTIRKRTDERSKLKTHKKQFFILYDVYAVE